MRTLSFILALGWLLAACADDNTADTERAFDRVPLLENVADNIIVPAYETLAAETEALTVASDRFTHKPTAQQLQALKEQWLAARLAWKTCEAFNFGPIDQRFLDTKMDLFPVSVVGLENAVAGYNGEADYLNSVGSDKKGFGALEYLLYHQGEAETVALFEQEKYATYLGLLTQDLHGIATTVLADWKDGYAETFKANTGNDAGASITLYTNHMIELIEIIKNFKVATPLGVRTNSDPLPNLVESPYANTSVALILKNLEIIETVFTGGAGEGLDDYLEALDLSDGEEPLATSIRTKIADCRTAAARLDNLQTEVTTNQTAVQALLEATQTLTTLTKSDMMSQLGIIVTFSSNDGD